MRTVYLPDFAVPVTFRTHTQSIKTSSICLISTVLGFVMSKLSIGYVNTSIVLSYYLVSVLLLAVSNYLTARYNKSSITLTANGIEVTVGFAKFVYKTQNVVIGEVNYDKMLIDYNIDTVVSLTIPEGGKNLVFFVDDPDGVLDGTLKIEG